MRELPLIFVVGMQFGNMCDLAKKNKPIEEFSIAFWIPSY